MGHASRRVARFLSPVGPPAPLSLKVATLAFYLATLAFYLAPLALYLATLAPGLLWGDHAYFQRAAFEGTLKADAGGHWLWLQLARAFARVPFGDVAYRANLLSAVAATATLALLYGAMRAVGIRRTAAALACLSLAVSHTFWMHAVRAEVYTVFTAMMALQLRLWFAWRPDRVWPVHAAAATFGLAVLGHQMAVLLLPAAAFLVWRRRGWLARRDRRMLAGALLVGLAPFAAVVAQQAAGGDFLSALRRHFTVVDVDFAPAMFDVSPSRLPRDAALWLGLLGLQLAGPAGLLGAYALAARRTWPDPWCALAIAYVATCAFAFSYRVNDRFVFYLPSYVAFSFLVADGAERWLDRRGRRTGATVALAVGLAAAPIATYRVLPEVLAAARVNPLGVRALPGRDPHRYFLWPATHGDDGAARFARTALSRLPRGATLVADHTPYEPLRYVQVVEGLRTDVRLVKVGPRDDLGALLAEDTAARGVFLADADPAYYDLESLGSAPIEPFGAIYRILPASSAPRR